MPRHVVGACPLDCPDACSWVVTVDDDGRAVKLRGNRDHPFTRGGLCVKVNPWLEFARSPGRLLHPLRRVGAKGEGRFDPVSWDDALAELAERLQGVIDRFGGEAIWPFVGTGSVGFLQGGGATARLWNVLGASEHAITICSIAGHAGMSYTTGTAAGMDPEDIAHSRLVVLWGTNTVSTNAHLWPIVERARRAGAPVWVVDPVRTRTADRADHHLAPMPGTDAALALGLAHVVITEGGADAAFLRDHCLGSAEFRDLVARYPPARVAALCDVDAAEVLALGQALATRRPSAIKVGQGMQRHAGGGQAARAISCLPAVTGDYHRRGGGLVYSTSPAYGLDTWALSRPDLRPGPVRSLAMTRLVEHLTELDDPPVKALVVMGANPVVSNPDQGGVRRALTRDDLFTVVVDAFPTDTVDYADLVLPTTLQTEHVEVMESFSHLYLNWNEPAVAPPGACLSRTELLRRLARALGRTEPELFASDEQLAADLLAAPRWRQAGITVDTLRARGWARIPGTDPYRPFTDGFPTPSRRVELASARADADGHGRLPDHRPPAEAVAPTTDGSLALVAAANHWFVNSTFAGETRNLERAGPPRVTVSPADARRLGLTAGELVEVHNTRGAFHAVLDIGAAARPGVAVTTKGWWAKLRPDGRSVNATVAERDADMARGAIYHDNRVRIRPVGP